MLCHQYSDLWGPTSLTYAPNRFTYPGISSSLASGEGGSTTNGLSGPSMPFAPPLEPLGAFMLRRAEQGRASGYHHSQPRHTVVAAES